MTDKDIQQGGTDWELAEAIRLMGEAQASGDSSQIATAMRRHAEALSNQATEKVAKPFTRIVGGMLDKKIGTLVEQFMAIRRDDNTRWHETDTRLQALADSHADIDQKQDALLDALAGVGTRLGKIEAEQRRQGAIVDARPAQRLAEQKERLAWQEAIERRVSELERERHTHAERSRDG